MPPLRVAPTIKNVRHSKDLTQLERASMSSNGKPTALEHLAAARRTELASQWPATAQVEQNLGPEQGGQTPSAMRWVLEGRLLAAYLPDPSGSWRFPTWQFCDSGQPIQQLPDILRAIRRTGQFLDTTGRATGWAEVEWFLTGHILLDGSSPAELLARSPRHVLRAALAEFDADI